MRTWRYVLVAWAFSLPLLADRVVYDSAGESLTLEGKIVKQDDTGVVILTDFEEELPIAASAVKEAKKGPHPVIDCLARHEKALKENKLDVWVELARFAKEKGLKRFEKEGWEQTVKLDAEHEEARLALGYVKVDGKWRTKSEAKARDLWSRRLENMQNEFSGRPWAMVAPVKTSLFDLKCSSTKDVEDRYRAFLEKALFPVYNNTFPKSTFKWHHEDNGKIFVFSNVGQFREYMLVPPGMGGFFDPEKNELYTFHGSFGIRGTTLHVLAHECAHLYQRRIMKDMSSSPSWLIEGMATYFGDGAKFRFSFRDKLDTFQASGIAIEPPYDRVILLKRFLQGDSWITLDKLLETPHFMFGGQFYAPAWLVVYWCLEGQKLGAHKGEGRKLLDEYLLHVTELSDKNGSNIPNHLKKEADVFRGLVNKHLGKTTVSLDEELKRFIRELRLDPVGTWDRGTRRWKGLGLLLTAPFGFNIVDQKDMEGGEVVAFGLPVGEYPRISVWAQSNDFLWRADEDLVPRWIDGLYEVDGEKEVRKIEGGVWPEGSVEAVFKGRRVSEMQRGQQQGAPKEEKKAEKKAEDVQFVKVRFAATTTPDKVYFFACESTEKRFDDDDKKFFEWFIKKKGVQLGE